MSEPAQTLIGLVAVVCLIVGVYRAFTAADGEVTRLVSGFAFVIVGTLIIVAGAAGVSL